MFEGSKASKLLCLFLRGSSVALRGKCEVCPPQDELNLSRSEEIEQNNLKSIYSDGRECPKSS